MEKSTNYFKQKKGDLSKDSEEKEYLLNILFLLKKRKLGIILFILFFAFGSVFFVKKKTQYYRAAASVELKGVMDKPNQIVFVSGAMGVNNETMIMKSYPVLMKAAVTLGYIGEDIEWDEIASSEEKINILKGIKGKIRTVQRPNTSIIDIIATSTDPKEARDVANAVARAYIRYRDIFVSINDKEARKYVEEKKAKLSIGLNKAEGFITKFKEENDIIDLDMDISNIHIKLQNMRKKIEDTEEKIFQIGNVAPALSRRGKLDMTELRLINLEKVNPDFSVLRDKLINFIGRRDELLESVTLHHPVIEALDKKIEETKVNLTLMLNKISKKLRSNLVRMNGEIQSINMDYQRHLNLRADLKQLEKNAGLIRNMINSLEGQYQENRIRSIYEVDRVTLIDPAILPKQHLTKTSPQRVFIGVILGLILGMAYAFLRETLDLSISNVGEIENFLGLPTLAVIPHFNPTGKAGIMGGIGSARERPLEEWSGRVISLYPKSPVAESLYVLLTKLWEQHKKGQILLVTSSSPNEGKTFVATNLATAFSQTGFKTLLLEVEMRRPTMHKVFNIRKRGGILDAIEGEFSWRKVIKKLPELKSEIGGASGEKASAQIEDSLDIITAGLKASRHPIVSLKQLVNGSFFDEIRQEYDMIIMDSPPVMAVADTSIIAPVADITLMVYRVGKVGRDVLKRACGTVVDTGANLQGLVLNDIDYQMSYSGSKYYYYYYHREYSYGMNNKDRHRWWEIKKGNGKAH